MSAHYGLRVGIVAILHTFNGKLEFNSHVHTLVMGGGLSGSSGNWVHRVYYDQGELMKSWRRALVRLLREALHAGQLQTTMTFDEIEKMLDQQERRCWIWALNPVRV